MIRRLTDVAGRMSLALMLAVLVWMIAVQEGDPARTEVFGQPIPIVLINQPPDTIVYNKSAETARVTLRAPASVWDTLTPTQISVTLNLANQPYGVLDVPLNVNIANKIVQVVRVEPTHARLSLEPTLLRNVLIRLTLTGEPALGYTIRAWTTSPAEVSIFGPASRVEQVAEVQAALNVQDKRQTIEQTVKLSARDAKGAVVEGVTLTPETAQARVIIEQLGGFRDLAVRAVITGQVASGYRISNIKVSPLIVAVFGSSQAIESLPGYVETVPVNVENARDSIIERVPLNLPGGISLLGDPSVQVEVIIEAIQGGLTLQLRPIVQGLAEGLEARLSPEYVDLVLTGPLPKLQTLRPNEDVRVIVDVANLERGTFQVAPQIVVPGGIVAESILPSTVQVMIVPAGTPSPLPTLTPTPTRRP